MTKHRKTFLMLATAALCTLGVGAAIAFAAGDSDDTLPVSKAFTATSTTVTTFTWANGATPSCPIGKSVLKFATDATGTIAQIDNLTSQTFGPGCTVTGGVAITFTTAGTWKVTYRDNRAEVDPSKTTDEVLGNNDGLVLTIPTNGMTATIAATGCVLNFAANGPISVEAAYNDQTGIAKFEDAQLPYNSNGVGIGCPVAGNGIGSLTGTYQLATVLADSS